MKKFMSLILSAIMILGIMSSFVFTASAEDFTDLNYHRYVEAINYMSGVGIIPGYADGSYHPEGSVSRSDAITILHQMFTGSTVPADKYKFYYNKKKEKVGLDTGFTDVTAGTDIAGIINWAKEKGIVIATGNKKFNPSTGLKAKEYVGLFVRAFGMYKEEPNLIYDFNYQFDTAYVEGLLTFFRVKGYNSNEEIPEGETEIGINDMYNFKADNFITRAEAAQVAYNFFTAYEVQGISVNEGETTSSLAKAVYQVEKQGVKLIATKNRPMGKIFNGDLLFSNGLVLDYDQNLDDYIGYTVEITYKDSDRNSSYTSGEKIYSIKPSTVMRQIFNLTDDGYNALYFAQDANLHNYTFVQYATIGGFTDMNIVKGYTNVTLNENAWPTDDPAYDFETIYKNEMNSAFKKTEKYQIKDRPHFRIEIYDDGDNIAADTVNCYEAKSGKVVGSDGDNIDIYDFYEDKTFSVSAKNVVSRAQYNIGDYVGYAVYGDGTLRIENNIKTEKYSFVSQKASQITLTDGNGKEVIAKKSKFFRSLGYNPSAGAEVYLISDGTGALALSDVKDKGMVAAKYMGDEGSNSKFQLLDNGSIIEVPASKVSQTIKDSGYAIYKFNGKEYVMANANTIIGTITDINDEYVEIITDGDNGIEVKRLELSGIKDLSINFNMDNIDKNAIYIVSVDSAQKVIGFSESSGVDIDSFKNAMNLVPEDIKNDTTNKVPEEKKPEIRTNDEQDINEKPVEATKETTQEATSDMTSDSKTE